MCIIVASPQDVIVPKSTLEQCYNSNSDGAGFMYADRNGLHIQKGFFSFEEFWDAYAPHERKKVVAHFRIKTHGEKNADNCHPFVVADDLAFVHNGIIKIEEDHPEYSDTWHFNEKIIKPMYKDNRAFIKRLYNQELIKGYIGYSKLVFMDGKGRSSIINADKGTWEEGVWYSNTSYKPVRQASKWTKLPVQAANTNNFIEGEIVVFKHDFGNHFKKDDWAYVENVFTNGQVEVITHRRMENGLYQEILTAVPIFFLKPLEDSYV